MIRSRCTISLHSGASESWRALKNCSDRLILDGKTLGANIDGYIPPGDAPRSAKANTCRVFMVLSMLRSGRLRSIDVALVLIHG
jgi:hypothetical protein